jgi:hypothetical protein
VSFKLNFGFSSAYKLELQAQGLRGSAAQDLPQAQAFELKLSLFEAHLKNYLKNGFCNFTKVFNLHLTRKLLFGTI